MATRAARGQMTRSATFLVTICLFCGCSCGTTALHGLTPVWQQTGHTLNTTQICAYDENGLRVADRALVTIAELAARAGLAEYPDGLPGIGVCLVAQPEPCGGVLAMGCAGDGWLWVARTRDGGGRDWRPTLIHEMVHAYAYAAGSAYPGDHSGPWAAIERLAHEAMACAL